MRFLYYMVLKPFSLLPSKILYGISSIINVVLYHIIGYRKKVVRMNIQNSFPELSIEEHRKIERKFYSHFCDLIVESIKAFSISRREIAWRFTHRNPEIFQKYFDQGQHVTLVGGHNGNWELFAVSIAMHLPHQPLALYTALNNEFMNRKIKASRSKFGLWMNNYAEAKQLVQVKTDKPVAFIFGSDQCPNIKQQPYWTEFLNQETGVQFGTEKFARDNNTPVIYGFIHKIGRGHYEAEYKLVCERPSDFEIGTISEMHTKMLEEDIRIEPSYWLWTHKRWKRKKKDFADYKIYLESLKSVA